MALPIPDPPPVTIAVLPAKPSSIAKPPFVMRIPAAPTPGTVSGVDINANIANSQFAGSGISPLCNVHHGTPVATLAFSWCVKYDGETFGHPMSSDASTKIDVWLAVGFGAGLYYFYQGFRTYREYRVLMDTPEVPIRSVAMGLVEVHGKATGVPPIPSPVTQTPCFFYQVDIEHWVTDKNGGHWSHLVTDTDGPRLDRKSVV